MPRRRTAQVFSLAEARMRRRLDVYRGQLERVVRSNRRAIGRLYTTGRMFTKAGSRAGRDLLTAHEHLLRVVSLLERLGDEGDVPAPRSQKEIDSVFRELDTLLTRTAELSESTASMFDELKRE